MANRLFNQFRLALEKQVVDLYLQATIGSSGAVTLSASNSKGIASITKESTAGQYTIVLQDAYVRLLDVKAMVTNSAGIPAAPNMGVMSASDVTAKSIKIQFSSGGSATNLSSSDVLNLRISLSNSTAN